MIRLLISILLLWQSLAWAGSSISFNDTESDSATVAGAALGANSVTVAAWVKINGFTEGTFTASDDNTGIVVFNTREVGADDSPTLMTSTVSGGAGTQQAALFTADSDGMAVGCKGATTLSTGTWYFLAGVYARDTGIATFAGTWDVYLNGVKDNTTSNNFNLASSHDGSFEGATWRLANNSQWGGTSNIIVSHLQVFTRALSVAEINEIMYKPGSVPESLQAYLPLWDEDMSITYDATTTTSGTASSFTFSHTTTSIGNRLLTVAVSWASDTVTVSGVTYNSVSMTSVGSQTSTVPNPDRNTQLFRLVGPATGANDVVVTLSASADSVVSSNSFYGVHQTTPVGTWSSNSLGNTGPTINITSVSGDIVIDTLAYDDTTETATVGSGQTQRWGVNTGGLVAYGSTEGATGSTTTMSWLTSGDGVNWAIGGVALKNVADALKDLSSNSYDGTSVGAASSSDGPPVMIASGVM